MAEITATAREPMKRGQAHRVGVWATALLLALSLSACGGGAMDSAQSKDAPSTQTSSTGTAASTDSTLATGAAPGSAELVTAESFESAGPLDELESGEIAAKSANALAALRIPVYRFTDNSTGAQRLTTSTAERDHLIATMSPPYRYEGVAFHVARAFSPGLSPVHRFFNRQTGLHFYTVSEAERADMVANMPQYLYEGVAFHASQVAGPGLIPLYRFSVPSRGYHIYTVDEAEKERLIASVTHRFEGIGYYVLDSSWRAEKLPHSGVTASQCYRVGSHVLIACSSALTTDLNAQQDGHRTAINSMSYSVVGSHPVTRCVRDDITGLIWEGKEANGTRAASRTYTHRDSGASTDVSGYVATVNAMNLCGFSDWRLPTRQELLGLVDYGRSSGLALNPSAFPNTVDTPYWSADLDSTYSLNAWMVTFSKQGGYSKSGSRHDAQAVRLVRGSSAPGGARFTFSTVSYTGDAANNAVNDAWTGLQWRRCEEGRVWSGSTCIGGEDMFTHEQALVRARARAGWRLPNTKELASLSDLGVSNGVRIDEKAFPDARKAILWSSSPYVSDASAAWGVDFGEGYVHDESRSNPFAVRLVRTSP